MPTSFVFRENAFPHDVVEPQRKLIVEEDPSLEPLVPTAGKMVKILVKILEMDRVANGEGAYADGDVHMSPRLPTKDIMECLKAGRGRAMAMSLVGVMVAACLRASRDLQIGFPLPNPSLHKREARRLLSAIHTAIHKSGLVRKPTVHADSEKLKGLIHRLGGTVAPRSVASIIIVANTPRGPPDRPNPPAVRILMANNTQYLCHYWYYPNSHNSWLSADSLENPPHPPYSRRTAGSSIALPSQLAVTPDYLYDSAHFNEFLEPEDYAFDVDAPTGPPLGRRCPGDWVTTIGTAGTKRTRSVSQPAKRRATAPDWYKAEFVSEFEAREFPDLAPNDLRGLREAVLRCAAGVPAGTYFSAYDATTMLHGDAGVIARVHGFLEQNKMINTGVYKNPLPTLGETAATPLLYVDTPSGVFPYSKVQPLTPDEEKTVLDMLSEATGDVDWDAIAQRVGRGASECLQCFLDMDFDGTQADDIEDDGVLTPFADSNNRVLTTLAFLAAVAPPEEVKEAGEAALEALVEQCKEGLTEEGEDVAAASAIEVLRKHAEKLVGAEETNLRRLSRQAVVNLLEQARIEIDAFSQLMKALTKGRQDIQDERERLYREEADLRRSIIARLKEANESGT